MDWAASEWKQNLSALAMQKVTALEEQVERLQKERQQKVYQVETLELALDKQKRKVEEEKQLNSTLQKEQQSLAESCQELDRRLQKLQQEITTRDSRINCLDGQLSQSRKQAEQESAKVQQMENELQQSQASFQEAKNQLDKLTTELSHQQELMSLQTENISSLKNKLKTAEEDLNKQKYTWDRNQNLSGQTFKDGGDSQAIERIQSLELQIKQQESLIQELQKQSADVKKSVPSCTNNASQLDSDISKLQIQIQHLQKENEELKQSNIKKQPSEASSNIMQTPSKSSNMGLWEKLGTPANNIGNRGQRNKITFEETSEKDMALEKKVKQLSQELNCQRHNSEAAKRSLEQKFKDKETNYKKEIQQQAQAFSDLDKEFNETKTRLQQELTYAKTCLDSTKAQLDKMEHQKLQQDREVNRLVGCVQALESRCQDKDNTISDLKKSTKNLEDTKGSLTSKVNQQEAKMKGLNQNIELQEQKLEKCKVEADMKKEELREKSKCVDELQRQIANLTQQNNSVVADLKFKIANMEKEKNNLEKSLTGIQCKLDHQIENEKILSQQLSKVNDKLTVTEKKLEEKIQLNNSLEQKLSSSECSVENKNKMVSQLQEELQVLKKCSSEKDDRVNVLCKELEVLKKNEIECKTTKEHLQNKLDKFTQELENKNKLIKELEDDCKKKNCLTRDIQDELNKAKKDLQGKVDELQKEICKKEKLDRSLSEEITSLKQSLANSTDEVSLLRNNLESLKSNEEKKDSRIAELQREMNEGNATLKNKDNELVKAQELLNSAQNTLQSKMKEVIELKDELLSINEKMEKKDKEVFNMQIELEALSKKEVIVAEMEVNVSSAWQERDNLEAENMILKNNLQTVTEELSSCKNDVGEKENNLKEMEIELKNSKDSFMHKVAELKTIEEKFDDLSLSYEESCNKVKSLEEELKLTREAVASKNNEVHCLNKTIEEHLCSLEKQKNEVKSIIGELHSAKQVVEEKDENLLKAKNGLISMKNDIVAKDVVIDDLRNSVQSLEALLSEKEEKVIKLEQEYLLCEGKLEEKEIKISQIREDLVKASKESERMAHLVNELQSDKNIKETDESVVTMLKEQLQNLGEQFQQQTNELANLTEMLQSATNDIHIKEDEIKELKASLQSMKEDTEEKDNKALKLETELLNIRQKDDKIINLEEQLKIVKKSYYEINNVFQNVKEELERMKEQVIFCKSEKEEIAQNLEVQLQTTRDAVQCKENYILELREELRNLRSDSEQSSNQKMELEKELYETKSDVQKKNIIIMELNTQLNVMQNEAEQNKNKYLKLEEDMSDVKNILIHKDNELLNLQKELQLLKEIITENEDKILELEEQNHQVSDAAEMDKGIILKLEKELAVVNNNMEQKEKQVLTLEEQVENMQCCIKGKEEEILTLEDELRLSKNEKEKQNVKIKELTQQILQLNEAPLKKASEICLQKELCSVRMNCFNDVTEFEKQVSSLKDSVDKKLEDLRLMIDALSITNSEILKFKEQLKILEYSIKEKDNKISELLDRIKDYNGHSVEFSDTEEDKINMQDRKFSSNSNSPESEMVTDDVKEVAVLKVSPMKEHVILRSKEETEGMDLSMEESKQCLEMILANVEELQNTIDVLPGDRKAIEVKDRLCVKEKIENYATQLNEIKLELSSIHNSLELNVCVQNVAHKLKRVIDNITLENIDFQNKMHENLTDLKNNLSQKNANFQSVEREILQLKLILEERNCSQVIEEKLAAFKKEKEFLSKFEEQFFVFNDLIKNTHKVKNVTGRLVTTRNFLEFKDQFYKLGEMLSSSPICKENLTEPLNAGLNVSSLPSLSVGNDHLKNEFFNEPWQGKNSHNPTDKEIFFKNALERKDSLLKDMLNEMISLYHVAEEGINRLKQSEDEAASLSCDKEIMAHTLNLLMNSLDSKIAKYSDLLKGFPLKSIFRGNRIESYETNDKRIKYSVEDYERLRALNEFSPVVNSLLHVESLAHKSDKNPLKTSIMSAELDTMNEMDSFREDSIQEDKFPIRLEEYRTYTSRSELISNFKTPKIKCDTFLDISEANTTQSHASLEATMFADDSIGDQAKWFMSEKSPSQEGAIKNFKSQLASAYKSLIEKQCFIQHLEQEVTCIKQHAKDMTNSFSALENILNSSQCIENLNKNISIIEDKEATKLELSIHDEIQSTSLDIQNENKLDMVLKELNSAKAELAEKDKLLIELQNSISLSKQQTEEFNIWFNQFNEEMQNAYLKIEERDKLEFELMEAKVDLEEKDKIIKDLYVQLERKYAPQKEIISGQSCDSKIEAGTLQQREHNQKPLQEKKSNFMEKLSPEMKLRTKEINSNRAESPHSESNLTDINLEVTPKEIVNKESSANKYDLSFQKKLDIAGEVTNIFDVSMPSEKSLINKERFSSEFSQSELLPKIQDITIYSTESAPKKLFDCEEPRCGQAICQPLADLYHQLQEKNKLVHHLLDEMGYITRDARLKEARCLYLEERLLATNNLLEDRIRKISEVEEETIKVSGVEQERVNLLLYLRKQLDLRKNKLIMQDLKFKKMQEILVAVKKILTQHFCNIKIVDPTLADTLEEVFESWENLNVQAMSKETRRNLNEHKKMEIFSLQPELKSEAQNKRITENWDDSENISLLDAEEVEEITCSGKRKLVEEKIKQSKDADLENISTSKCKKQRLIQEIAGLEQDSLGSNIIKDISVNECVGEMESILISRDEPLSELRQVIVTEKYNRSLSHESVPIKCELLLPVKESDCKISPENSASLPELTNELLKLKIKLQDEIEKNCEMQQEKQKLVIYVAELEDKVSTQQKKLSGISKSEEQIEYKELLAKLQSELDLATMENNSLQAKLSSVSSKVEEFKITTNELKKFSDVKEEQLFTKEKEIKDLQNMVDALQQQIRNSDNLNEDLKDSVSEMEKKLHQAEKITSTVENEKTTLREQLDELQSELYRAVNEANSFQLQLAALNCEIDDLKLETRGLQKLSDLKEHLDIKEKEAKEFRNMLTALENQLQSSEISNENCRKAVSEIEEDLQQAKSCISNMQKEKTSMENTFQEKIRELQEELNLSHNKNSSLQSQLDCANSEIKELKSIVDKMQSFTEVNEQLECRKKEISDMQNQVMSLESLLNEKDKELSTMGCKLQEGEQKICTDEKEKLSLLKQLQDNHDTINRLNNAIEEVEENLQEVYVEKQQLEENVNNLQKVNSEIQKKCSQLETLAEQKACSGSSKDLENTIIELKEANACLEKANLTLEEKYERTLDLELKNVELETKILELEDTLENTLNSVQQMEEKYNTEKHKRGQLEETLNNLDQQFKSEATELQMQVQNLQMEITLWKTSNDKLSLEVKELKEKFSNLNSSKSDSVEECNTWMDKAKDFELKVQQLVGEKSFMEEHLKESEVDCARFKEELNNLSDQLAKTKDELSQNVVEKNRILENKNLIVKYSEELEQEIVAMQELKAENAKLKGDVERFDLSLQSQKAVTELFEEENIGFKERLGQLAKVEENNVQLNHHIQKLEEELRLREGKAELLRKAEIELLYLKSQNTDLECSKNFLQADLLKVQEEAKRVTEELQFTLREIESKKFLIVTLEEENEMLKNKMDQLIETDIVVMKSQLYQIQEQLSKEKEKVKCLKETENELVNIKSLKEALESKIKFLEEELHEIKQQSTVVSEMENEILSLSSSKLALEEQVTILQSQINEIKSKDDDLVKQLKDTESEKLCLKNLLDELKENIKTLAENKEELTCFKTELEEKNKEIWSLKSAIDEKQKLDIELQALQSEKNELLVTIERHTEEGRLNQKSHEKQLSLKNAQVDALKVKLDMLSTESDSNKRLIENFIQCVMKMLSSYTGKLNSSLSLKDCINDINELLTSKEELIKKLESSNSEMKLKIQEMNTDRQKNDELEKLNQNLCEEKQKLLEEINKLESTVADTEKLKNLLAEELNRATQQISEKEAKIKHLTEDYDRLMGKMKLTLLNSRRLEKQHSKLQNQLSDCKGEAAKLKEEFESQAEKASKNDEYCAEIKSLKEQVMSRDDEIDKMKSELETVWVNYGKTIQELQESKQSNQHLQISMMFCKEELKQEKSKTSQSVNIPEIKDSTRSNTFVVESRSLPQQPKTSYVSSSRSENEECQTVTGEKTSLHVQSSVSKDSAKPVGILKKCKENQPVSKYNFEQRTPFSKSDQNTQFLASGAKRPFQHQAHFSGSQDKKSSSEVTSLKRHSQLEPEVGKRQKIFANLLSSSSDLQGDTQSKGTSGSHSSLKFPFRSRTETDLKENSDPNSAQNFTILTRSKLKDKLKTSEEAVSRSDTSAPPFISSLGLVSATKYRARQKLFPPILEESSEPKEQKGSKFQGSTLYKH